MGFTNEIHNLMLLKQFNGNMDAVAEVLITEGSQDSKGKHKKLQSSSSSSDVRGHKKSPSSINTNTPSVSIPTRSASVNSPRVDSMKHFYTSPSYEYASGIRQLKAMGFTDFIQMKNALEKVCIFYLKKIY